MIRVTDVMVLSDSTIEVNYEVEYASEKCKAHFICGAKSLETTQQKKVSKRYNYQKLNIIRLGLPKDTQESR